MRPYRLTPSFSSALIYTMYLPQYATLSGASGNFMLTMATGFVEGDGDGKGDRNGEEDGIVVVWLNMVRMRTG